MTETKHNIHPVMDTKFYTNATIPVPDKYDLIRLTNEFLLALYFASRDTIDETTAVDQSVSVTDSYVQLTLAFEDLAKDMGGSAAFAYGHDETAQVIPGQTTSAENTTVEVNDPYGLMDLTMAFLEEPDDKFTKVQDLASGILSYFSDFENARKA